MFLVISFEKVQVLHTGLSMEGAGGIPWLEYVYVYEFHIVALFIL